MSIDEVACTYFSLKEEEIIDSQCCNRDEPAVEISICVLISDKTNDHVQNFKESPNSNVLRTQLSELLFELFIRFEGDSELSEGVCD